MEFFDDGLPGLVIDLTENQVFITGSLWMTESGGEIGMAGLNQQTAIA